MFGILSPFLPELKVKDAEYYRAAYCGVCRAIKRSFGDLPRFALRYEAATLAVLWMSLAGEEPDTERRICAARPLRPHPVLTGSPALERAGAVCLVLADAKLSDAVRDGEKALAMGSARAALSSAVRKAEASLKNETVLELRAAQEDLVRLEKERCAVWDEAADTSGRMLRAVFLDYEGVPGSQREPLAWMGYHLGRWLYLTDAWLDAEEDERKGSYNPVLLSPLGREEARAKVREGADFSAAQAWSACDLMDWRGPGGAVVLNLLEHGLPAAYHPRTKGRA